MWKFITSFILALTWFSGMAQDSLELVGMLSGFNEGDIINVMIKEGNTRRRIGKVPIINKQIHFKYFLEETPNELKIYPQGSSNPFYIWVQNEKIEFKAEKENFSSPKNLSGQFTISERYFNEAFNDQLSLSEKLNVIAQHSLTPSAIYQLYRIMREAPIPHLRNIMANVNPENADADHFRSIQNYINAPIRDLQKGAQFVDFTAQDFAGNKVVFSKLIRNKYTLLEFSSQYCSWTKRAIPELSDIYSRNDNKLQIVTFLTDTRLKLWERFKEKSEIPWLKIYDGHGEIGPTCTSYNVKGSPHYFLISPTGEIIERWFGFEKGQFNNIFDMMN